MNVDNNGSTDEDSGMIDGVINFVVWVGGTFVHNPRITYKGGRREIFKNYDLDRISMHDFFWMYKEMGGKKGNINVYYLLPNYSLENGLRELRDDESIRDLQRVFENIPYCSIYVEESYDPIAMIDTQGNIMDPNQPTLAIERQTDMAQTRDGDIPMEDDGVEFVRAGCERTERTNFDSA